MFRMENKGSLSSLSYPNILPAQFHGIEYNKHSHANIFHLHIFNSETIKVLFLIWWQKINWPFNSCFFAQWHTILPDLNLIHAQIRLVLVGCKKKNKRKHTQLAGVTSNGSDINHEMKTFHNQNDETVKHNMLICKGKANDFLKRRVASHTHTYCMPMFMIIYSYDVLVFWNIKQCWLNLSVVYVVVSKIFYGLKMVKQLIL